MPQVEEDRKLPQIGGILPMLRRGIGVHHSGAWLGLEGSFISHWGVLRGCCALIGVHHSGAWLR